MTKVSKKSTDPRVLRTRMMLRQALFALLEKQHFDTITVLEISHKAGLNPATFYLHYDDKWDLLNSIVAELSAIMDQQPDITFVIATHHEGDTSILELKLFEHIEQYRDFYRLMLGRNGIASVRYELQRQFEKIVRIVLERLPEAMADVDVPPALVEHYFAGAYVAIIEWWLSSKEPISPQQIARWMEVLWRSSTDRELQALFRTPQ
ncbi:MAG: TetR/AcrR family transcriptional regulator C-terminal domain-containing protein [Chloroflexota bacterium]|nr:TetR/AcrR family transcriptional regulator C-terminal domain-containing protein [Chloroflexota bacterium]